MRFDQVFNEVKSVLEKGDYSSFDTGVYSYEFNITGEGEGKFYLEVRDGNAYIQPYDYHNSTCVITMSSKHILKLLNGELTPTSAYSTGRLKIKGDVSAVFRLTNVIGLNF